MQFRENGCVCVKTMSYENGLGRKRGHVASCCDTDEAFTISVLFGQFRGERGMHTNVDIHIA